MKKTIKILKNIIVLLAVASLTQCDEDDVTPKTHPSGHVVRSLSISL